MPLRTLQAMLATALLLKRPSLALCLVLGFVGFLRTTEILQLSVDNIKLYAPSQSIVLVLAHTKTTGRRLAKESLVLAEPSVFRLVSHLLPSQGRLWKGSFSSFLKVVRALAAHLGYPRDLFTGYSLRRGGATWHYLQNNSLAATMLRGRWQQEKTARIYLDDARASLVTLHESNECRAR
eukprot:6483986-Amphidinium_carterae.1